MPAPAPPPVVRVSHLTKRFGAQVVVDDLSFEVAAGETLVLLGPSGCGKTTLLKLLNRLIEPDDGTVEINGRDVRRQAPEALRRGIGYVIQQVGLLPHYTVAQNIAVVPGLLGRPVAETAARTAELLDRLHLPAARFGPLLPAQLSGGQQQRVGLARALAADPPIVLMDEPFGALDPITRAAVRRDFRELDELRRKTVVLVTHDVQEAFELADRILLLNHGRIQQLGAPRELLLNPANAFVRSFFQAEQLALQLRVLTLADALPFFAFAEAGAPPAGARPLPLTASLQEALARLTDPAATPPSPESTVPSPNAPTPSPNASVPSLKSTVPSLDSSVPSPNSIVPSLKSTVPSLNAPIPSLNASVPSPESPIPSPESTPPSPEPTVPSLDAAVRPLDATGRGAAATGAGLWVALPTGAVRPVALPQFLAAVGHVLQAANPPRA